MFIRPFGLAALAALSLAWATPGAAQGHRWTADSARALGESIGEADDEGLDPDDYRPAALEGAIEAGEGPELDRIAGEAALALARDYSEGRITDRESFDWHIARSPYDAHELPARLDAAVARGEVRAFLAGLLPTDPRYAALRDALAATPAANRTIRNRIRANLERWRWMPRVLGERYVYVNLPSYTLELIEDGAVRSTYAVIVGAKATPTPQLAVPASALVINPWWHVPTSIVRSSGLRPGAANRRKGYVFTARAEGGYAVRQRPGPGNSLGRIKIDMPNDYAIYLHDTPAKALFARPARALSHGCIRVRDIDRLAAELAGDDPALDDALASAATATVPLPQQWPVYLVYFTADATGGKLVTYGDPYGRDAALVARLDRRTAVAAR